MYFLNLDYKNLKYLYYNVYVQEHMHLYKYIKSFEGEIYLKNSIDLLEYFM